MPTLERTQVLTAGGNAAVFAVRPDTNDAALVAGIITGDEYDLASEPPVTGWVLDIGAHIGIMSVAIALDNPDAKVIAVEAIAENAELVRENASLNHLADRIFVETAGASEPGAESVSITYGYTSVGVPGNPAPVVEENYVIQSRFIGNIFEYPEGQMEATTEQVAALSLDDILAKYDIDRVALLKTDCEGCEYAFLRSPLIARVDRIIGEFHSGAKRIHAMLRKTHTVTITLDQGGVGMFTAVRK